MPKPQKTLKRKVVYRPPLWRHFAATQELYNNQVVSFYFEVIQAHPDVLELSSQQALTALERLTLHTKKNPNPVMPLHEGITVPIPAMFRRAAINEAQGRARSFYSNWARYDKHRRKERAKGRKPHGRPPRPPRRFNSSVVFYKGMWKERREGSITLKLWTGKAWKWCKVLLHKRPEMPGWEPQSPMLVERSRNWCLHTPMKKADFAFPQKLEEQVRKDPALLICAVDLNYDRQVAVIMDAEGEVYATGFVGKGQEVHDRRRRQLGRIAEHRKETGVVEEGVRDNKHRWDKVANIDEDEAHLVSCRIVEFALQHGAKVIVFEYLGSFRPVKGSYSRRKNERRAYWLQGRMQKYTRYKAWEHGIIVTRVNPKNTSRRCSMCGSLLTERRGDLFRCLWCGYECNVHFNGSCNIGLRFWHRYQKPGSPWPVRSGVVKAKGALACLFDKDVEQAPAYTVGGPARAAAAGGPARALEPGMEASAMHGTAGSDPSSTAPAMDLLERARQLLLAH